MTFDPKILAFCCNWCSYPAADLAGTARMQYPSSLRIIRVMCSGMVHPNLVVEAFQHGADGVMIMGCHLGECHYQDGNYRAQDRVAVIEEMLDALGLEQERFRLAWCSLAEADRFVGVVRSMTDTVRELGPSPYRGDGEVAAEERESAECRSR